MQLAKPLMIAFRTRHAKRNHQGLGNRLIRSTPSVAANDRIVRRRQRLGGILNFYYQEAA